MRISGFFTLPHTINPENVTSGYQDGAMAFSLVQIGRVVSPIKNPRKAPKMESEGGAVCEIHVDPLYSDALLNLEPGQEMFLFTWLHLSDRNTLRVHPRGDASRPLRGVFNTRSPDRPNPIGLHAVRIQEIKPGPVLVVSPLEAVDGTPVVDIKPRN